MSERAIKQTAAALRLLQSTTANESDIANAERLAIAFASRGAPTLARRLRHWARQRALGLPEHRHAPAADKTYHHNRCRLALDRYVNANDNKIHVGGPFVVRGTER